MTTHSVLVPGVSTSDELGLLPPPLWGRGGEGGGAMTHQRRLACTTPTPNPSPAKVGFARLRPSKMPNSGKPEFGWGGERTELAIGGLLPLLIPLKWNQRERRTRSAPSPLVGEGWGGGWCSEISVAPPAQNRTTPTPNPSPQGGGEHTEIVACPSILILKLF